MNISDYSIQRVSAKVTYEPTGDFIDNKGKLIDYEKERWGYRQFSDDKLNFQDDTNNNKAYLTWKEAGFLMEQIDTTTIFCDHVSNKFSIELFEMMNVEKFTQAKFVVSLLYKSQDSFSDLLYSLKPLLNIGEDEFDIIRMDFIDLGFPLVFKNHKSKVQIRFGPMEKEQMKDFFENTDFLPEIAIFAEIQYIFDPDFLETNNLKSLSQEVFNFVENEAAPFIEKLLNKEA